jgi:hypothetical protein
VGDCYYQVIGLSPRVAKRGILTVYIIVASPRFALILVSDDPPLS